MEYRILPYIAYGKSINMADFATAISREPLCLDAPPKRNDSISIHGEIFTIDRVTPYHDGVTFTVKLRTQRLAVRNLASGRVFDYFQELVTSGNWLVNFGVYAPAIKKPPTSVEIDTSSDSKDSNVKQPDDAQK